MGWPLMGWDSGILNGNKGNKVAPPRLLAEIAVGRGLLHLQIGQRPASKLHRSKTHPETARASASLFSIQFAQISVFQKDLFLETTKKLARISI